MIGGDMSLRLTDNSSLSQLVELKAISTIFNDYVWKLIIKGIIFLIIHWFGQRIVVCQSRRLISADQKKEMFRKYSKSQDLLTLIFKEYPPKPPPKVSEIALCTSFNVNNITYTGLFVTKKTQEQKERAKKGRRSNFQDT